MTFWKTVRIASYIALAIVLLGFLLLDTSTPQSNNIVAPSSNKDAGFRNLK